MDINMSSWLPSQPQDPAGFCQSFHAGLVWSGSESRIAFGCRISPVSFSLEQFLSLSLAFRTLTLKIAACSMSRCEFIWLDRGLHVWQEYCRNAAVFSLCFIRLRCDPSLSCYCYVHFDHLSICGILGSVRLFHGKALFIHFVINKHFVGKIWNHVNIPFLTELSFIHLLFLYLQGLKISSFIKWLWSIMFFIYFDF